MLYALDGSLCIDGQISPGAARGFGTGDTIGVLVEQTSLQGTVTFYINGLVAVKTSLPGSWQEKKIHTEAGHLGEVPVLKYAIDFGLPGEYLGAIVLACWCASA